MLQEFDRAVLLEDIPDTDFIAGDLGIVLAIHGSDAGYKLEMVTADGHTLAVITVLAHQVRAVTRRDMLHVRELEADTEKLSS